MVGDEFVAVSRWLPSHKIVVDESILVCIIVR